jgi:hypothetical protein
MFKFPVPSSIKSSNERVWKSESSGAGITWSTKCSYSVWEFSSKEIVEYGKEGRLYLEKEKGTVKIEDNIVTIDHHKLTFKGKLEKITQTNCIYNVSNDNILETLNGATMYKGIVDFDMEGILKEKLN